MKGHTIWFTGLSGSGKTTIANELAKHIRERREVVVVDGDDARKWISYDLGYSKYARDKHIARVAGVCYILTSNDVMNIGCVISPTKKVRRYARSLIKQFSEIYIDCPLEICEQRDVKGHYKKVREGTIKQFVGFNVPYQIPEHPELVVHTNKELIKESVEKIILYLEKKGLI